MVDIARWLESRFKAEQYRERRDDQGLRVACAALLVEAARADHHFAPEEQRRLHALLRERFGLTDDESEALAGAGADASRDAVSLTHLTQVVNRHCGLDERVALLRMMWHVALADGRVDKYEEYVLRQVANLLHLAHDDYLRARFEAQAASPG